MITLWVSLKSIWFMRNFAYKQAKHYCLSLVGNKYLCRDETKHWVQPALCLHFLTLACKCRDKKHFLSPTGVFLMHHRAKKSWWNFEVQLWTFNIFHLPCLSVHFLLKSTIANTKTQLQPLISSALAFFFTPFSLQCGSASCHVCFSSVSPQGLLYAFYFLALDCSGFLVKSFCLTSAFVAKIPIMRLILQRLSMNLVWHMYLEC